jgi:hypothetical protein
VPSATRRQLRLSARVFTMGLGEQRVRTGAVVRGVRVHLQHAGSIAGEGAPQSGGRRLPRTAG